MFAPSASPVRPPTAREVIDAFLRAKSAELAVHYGKSADWILRGLEACERAGVPHAYFILRYLDGDTRIPLNLDVAEALNVADDA